MELMPESEKKALIVFLLLAAAFLLLWILIGGCSAAAWVPPQKTAQEANIEQGQATQTSQQGSDQAAPQANPVNSPIQHNEPNVTATKTTETGDAELSPKIGPTISEMDNWLQNVTTNKYGMDTEMRKLIGGFALIGAGLFIMALFLPAPANGKWEVPGVLIGAALVAGAVWALLV